MLAGIGLINEVSTSPSIQKDTHWVLLRLTCDDSLIPSQSASLTRDACLIPR